jgi:hypothetical protein
MRELTGTNRSIGLIALIINVHQSAWGKRPSRKTTDNDL